MQSWNGVIARLDTPSLDGRVIRTPETLSTGDMPLPLLVLGGGPAGAVTAVTVHGDELRAEGTVRDGLLVPGEDMPVGVELDRVNDTVDGELYVLREWRLRAVTIYLDRGRPAFHGAYIRLSTDR